MYQLYVNGGQLQSSALIELSDQRQTIPTVVVKSYDRTMNKLIPSDYLMRDQELSTFPKLETYNVTIITEVDDRHGKTVIVFRATTLGYFLAYDGIIRHHGLNADGAILAFGMYI